MLEALLDEAAGDESHPAMSLADIVGDLITVEEAVNHAQPPTNGLQAMKFLMEQHGVKQGDLPEVGSQGVVSEILAGKRELNLRQVRALAERFGVSPSTFVCEPRRAFPAPPAEALLLRFTCPRAAPAAPTLSAPTPRHPPELPIPSPHPSDAASSSRSLAAPEAVVMSHRYQMSALPERCTGCLLCQLEPRRSRPRPTACQALVAVTRIGFEERYDVRFGPDCDACGFCVNYCAYDAIGRTRNTQPRPTAEDLQ